MSLDQEYRGINVPGGLVLMHVVDELDTGPHGVPPQAPCESAAHAPSRTDGFVARDERRAARFAGKRIAPIEGELVERGAERCTGSAERALVLRINQRVTIDGLLAMLLLVEQRPERGSRHVAPPASIRAGNGQALEVQAAVKLLDAFAIEPFCQPIVGARRVECRKVEPFYASAVLVS